MFTLRDPEPYPWPATVSYPDPDKPGKRAEQSFTVRFRQLGKAALDELVERAGGEDTVLLREVVVGWDGVQDADGRAIPFSSGMLDRLLDDVPVRQGLIVAWWDSMSNPAVTERARGNFGPRPGRGPRVN